MYSVNEAARIMGISERHLRLLLENGQVLGKKLGHDWVVLELNYERKRRPKGGENVMPKLRVTMELVIGAGRKPSRRPSKEESLVLDLLFGGTRSVREVIEDLTSGGKIPKGLALSIIKGAISAGILQGFTLG